MKINQKVIVGMNAVKVLKERTLPMKSQELAILTGTSPAFTEQVMRQLRIAGIVLAKRGPGGGYMLHGASSVTAWKIAIAVGALDSSNELLSTPEGILRTAITKAFMDTAL